MLSKSEIQYLSKLNLKKFRHSEQKFIVEGKRIIEEGLKSNFNCSHIIVTNDFSEKERDYCAFLEKTSSKLFTIGNKEFSKITTTKNPQGVAAVFDIPTSAKNKFDDHLIVGLENISDPGNVGTILRSCDWFGFQTVILSEDCAEIYNPKVVRASMGAIFSLNIIEEANLVDTLDEANNLGYTTYYADMNGKDYRSLKRSNKSFVVFCNEAFGPTSELRNVCKQPITIPSKGNIESLNVSAAAAVVLSEFAD